MEQKDYLKDLLKKFITGELTSSEKESFFESLQEVREEQHWKTVLLELSQENHDEITYDPAQWEAVIMEILGVEPAAAPVHRIGTNRWRYAVAAAILFATGVAIYKFATNPSITPTIAVTPIKNDALPGGNKAILKLANGQNIILDSAANGSLAIQGNAKVVKLSNGKIAYQNENKSKGELVFNTISTPRGGRYNLTLSDGTQVWLNAASSITFPTDFTGTDREVKITGEAYFEVASNPKPFHVRFGNTDVEVLGTHFNVSSYEDEAYARTTLLEGSVRVVDGTQHIQIKPGEQVAEAANGELSKLTHVDLEQVMAWKNGLFNFDGADLQQVLRQLGRWYDVEIVYEGSVPQRRFGGEIPMDLNLSQVLKVLQKVEVNFRIEGKKLIVSSR